MSKPDRKSKVYHPSDAYAPLVERDATEHDLLGILLNQASPFLPTRILRDKETRREVIEEILSIRLNLQRRYLAILEDSGLGDLASEIRKEDGQMTEVESICRKIADLQTRERVRLLLGEVRDSMDPEFLERLGFLPENLFSRTTVTGEDPQTAQLILAQFVPHEDEQEVRFRLLREFFPKWFPFDEIHHAESIISRSIGEEDFHKKLQAFGHLSRLARWIIESQKDFQESVNEAFSYLDELMKRAGPKGAAGQAYESVSDLGTKSFAELLGIVLTKKMPLRRRFEALRLLEWSIAFFSIKRNPVFQAQQKVRAHIHELLEINVWHPNENLLPLRVDPSIWETVCGKEVGRCPKKPILQIARKVNEEVQEILRRHSQTASREEHSDRIIFESRDKSLSSTIRKIVEYLELAAKSRATLEGMETDISETFARKKLAKFRRRTSLRHKKIDFETKPVSYDSLDDSVGFSLALDLQKPLDGYEREERPEVNNLFRELANHLVETLGLRNVSRPENHLWKKNLANKKSSADFRVFKVHGDYPIEADVFEEGRLVKKLLLVPVEIQLMPVETSLRLSLSGRTGRRKFVERKAKDLGNRLLPSEIRGRRIYGPLDLTRLEEALSQA